MDAWLPLVGLIHDCGKILGITGELPQWAIVGDTFPVGCSFDPANVLHARAFWRENPDWKWDTSEYCDPIGPLYTRGGGLEQLLMSWGHDEYLAMVLERHAACALPPEAIYVIRFHSFYPWHTPRRGAARGYTALASARDCVGCRCSRPSSRPTCTRRRRPRRASPRRRPTTAGCWTPTCRGSWREARAACACHRALTRGWSCTP